MKAYFLIIVGIFAGIYGVINYYIGALGWQFVGSRVPYLNNRIYWELYCLIVISFILGRLLNKHLPYFLISKINLVGSYWIAAMAYFLLFIMIIGFIELLDSWIGFLPGMIKNNSYITSNIGVFVFIIVVILLIWGTLIARNTKVTSYDITINKRAGDLNKLNIAMISDIHLGNIDDGRLENIVKVINSLNPDIVLIAGDIIEDIVPFSKQDMAKEFRKIKSKFGVYASLGNHDYMAASPEQVEAELRNAEISVLRDSGMKIGESFYLLGREDKDYERMSRKKRKAIAEIMNGIEVMDGIDGIEELPVIMLDHQPINLQEAEKAGVDLELSGHTHKGQFFPFNLVTKRVFKSHYGYLRMGGLQLIVSSGASTWGPPVRIATISEVVEIKVKFS